MSWGRRSSNNRKAGVFALLIDQLQFRSGHFVRQF
jgi:hypothetical protein